jgi:hypothetical protein
LFRCRHVSSPPRLAVDMHQVRFRPGRPAQWQIE